MSFVNQFVIKLVALWKDAHTRTPDFFPHLDDIDLRFLHCLLAILTEAAPPQRQILFVSAQRRCAYIQK